MPGVMNKSEGRDQDRHEDHVSLGRRDMVWIHGCFVLVACGCGMCLSCVTRWRVGAEVLTCRDEHRAGAVGTPDLTT